MLDTYEVEALFLSEVRSFSICSSNLVTYLTSDKKSLWR